MEQNVCEEQFGFRRGRGTKERNHNTDKNDW